MKINLSRFPQASAGFLLTVLCGAVIIFSGCAEKTPLAEQANPTLYIGVIAPTEGDVWLYGRECIKGMTLAVKEINQTGGIKGVTLALKILNNDNDSLRSVQIVQELAKDSLVIAIVGPVTTNTVQAAAAAAEREKIPLLSPYSTNSAITEIGEYITSICFTDVAQAQTLAKYSIHSLGIKRVAVVYEKGNIYSEGLAALFEREFTAFGGEIIAREAYLINDNSYIPNLEKVFLKRPDAIFQPSYYPQAAQLIKDVVSLNKKTIFLGGDGWELLEKVELPEVVLSGNYQIYITSHFSSEDLRYNTQHFVKLYEDNYNTAPNALSALAYDSGLLLIDALKRAPRLDRASLKEAIISTREFTGATGTITINEKRNAVKPVYVLEFRGNQFHLRAYNVPQ